MIKPSTERCTCTYLIDRDSIAKASLGRLGCFEPCPQVGITQKVPYFEFPPVRLSACPPDSTRSVSPHVYNGSLCQRTLTRSQRRDVQPSICKVGLGRDGQR